MRKIFRIIYLVTIIVMSCTKSDYYNRIDYVFNNNTDHLIEFALMGDVSRGNSLYTDTTFKYNISSGSFIKIKTEGSMSIPVSEISERHLKLNYNFGDSMKIVFDNSRYLMYYKDASLGNDSTYLISSYSYTQFNENSAMFNFDINENEYNKSLPINNPLNPYYALENLFRIRMASKQVTSLLCFNSPERCYASFQ